MTSQLDNAGGWHPDPSGRYEFRWFNGTTWTQDVSIDGVRYVDDGRTVVAPPPSKTLAVVGFLLGLASLMVEWMPFLFVLGAFGAIAAIAIGIVALRRAGDGRVAGRGFAIAGLALGGAAVPLCSVGVLLTLATIDEFVAYTDPGPVAAELVRCESTGSRVVIEGTITNLDDSAHDYDVAVEVRRAGKVLRILHRAVEGVVAGETQTWSTSTIVNKTSTDGQVSCEIFAVNGPFPFGLVPG
ncbi:MAG: DUF2510 domain-containing protein [Actinomycetota bacterium]